MFGNGAYRCFLIVGDLVDVLGELWASVPDMVFTGGVVAAFIQHRANPWADGGTCRVTGGHKHTSRFNTADASIPILPTGLFADNGHDSLFKKKGGKLIHVPTGETIHVFRMHGVYFFRFKASNAILNPSDGQKPDFHSGTAH